MDIVREVLEKQKKHLEQYKPITVEKHLEVRNDVGMLMCSDPNDLDEIKLKESKEDYLLRLTRENIQLLINDIWDLPTERIEECIVAKLPQPNYVLPRLRKVPGPKELTKWEKFAKEKGITKKKKDTKVYDTVLDKWVPTYGFKRAQAEKEKEWVLEVPKNVDPMEDQFKKKMDLRSEKVAKNEIQRMKNIVRAKKIQTPRTGYLGPEAASATQLSTATTIAKASTASVGKFQDKLPKEKVARGLGVKELIPGKKRKASHLSDVPEKTQNLEMVQSILNKKPKIDIDKAISIQKQEERIEREMNPEKGKTPRKSKKGNGKKRSKFMMKAGKKPKGGKGLKNPKITSVGRKRR